MLEHLDMAARYVAQGELPRWLTKASFGGSLTANSIFTKAGLPTCDGFAIRARRTAKSEAEQAFIAEKTKALQIRNEERSGKLVPTEAACDAIDAFVAAATIEIQAISAGIAPLDIAMRRKIDAAVLVHERASIAALSRSWRSSSASMPRRPMPNDTLLEAGAAPLLADFRL
jgi:hypothetical protein